MGCSFNPTHYRGGLIMTQNSSGFLQRDPNIGGLNNSILHYIHTKDHQVMVSVEMTLEGHLNIFSFSNSS